MALQKDRARVNIKGGGTFEISTDGGTTFSDVGYLAESGFLDDPDTEDVYDEVGDLVNVLEGNKKVSFDTVLLQTTLDEINLIRNNKGSVIHSRYKVELTNGNWQAWAFGDCMIRPKIDLKFNTSKRTLPIIIVLLKGSTTGKYWEMTEGTEPTINADWPDVS